MLHALALARRALGRVAPNPAVGCVIVQAGRVVGRGWTQPGGRPHAETEALTQAGSLSKDATAYVTLEPCAHHGQTPPCAEALATAGIARCVVALEDPDPRVDGKGLELLRQAGIAVESGLCREAAAELNSGFLIKQRAGRPLVTLKLATTLDGRIASRSGQSRWITGPEARRQAHYLRSTHDAVLVGSETAILDDPRLDVRLPGLAGRSPVRVVLDGRLRLPLTHDLVVRADSQETLLFTREDSDPQRRAAYSQAGVTVLPTSLDAEGFLSLTAVLHALGQRGLTRLLVEGGGRVAAGLLSAGLVDRVAWFRAPKIMGGDGAPAVAGFGIEQVADCPGFIQESLGALGDDILETFRRGQADD